MGKLHKLHFPSPFQFSKLYMTVQTKFIALSDVVLNKCKGNV